MNEHSDIVGDAVSESVFSGSLPLEAKLERARTELLDLSARNRLLNIPRSSRTAKTIEIVDEKSVEIFRILVHENKPFTFLPARAPKGEAVREAESDEDEVPELAQPDDDHVNDRGVLLRHADTKLQTRLTSAGLQKRLLDLYADARTLEEEQGVNILFLALGTLKWIDPANANNVRYAPLVLVPVSLERGSVAERFKLKWRQEEQSANLSLEAYLDRVHSLKLPRFESGDEFDPGAYMADVAEVVTLKQGWAVMPDDIVLGFFSFSKFLMYRDLDPQVWPPEGKLTDLPLIRSLVVEGFSHRSDAIAEDALIDAVISPAEMGYIVDSDSSQTLAVYDARHGQNLVIQGPPGTGKSQTIANIIACAIADGKTVLFVAEKMAALEVVKRRLDQAGVGDACLELHSNKANKRSLLEELRRTWELGSPRGEFPDSLNSALQDARDGLNGHAARVHTAHSPSGLTPYQVIGELVRLRKQGHPPTELRLDQPERWSQEDRKLRERLLEELAQRVTEIGCPNQHPWWCVGLDTFSPMQADRLIRRIADLSDRLSRFVPEQVALASLLGLGDQKRFSDFNVVVTRARRVATAPVSLGQSLAAREWEDCRASIAELLAAGSRHAHCFKKLSAVLLPAAWSADIDDVRTRLGRLPADFDSSAFERIGRLRVLLPQLVAAAERLRDSLGLLGDAATMVGIGRILEIGGHVAAAPAAAPGVLTAAVWDHGIDQLGDLVEALGTIEEARIRTAKRLSDSAWTSDCVAARLALASHGASVFRFLSGDWRRANRTVKSLLLIPNLPLQEVLALLDILARGQRAVAAVQTGDALGRAAFGAQWRGEKSNPATLRALLTWTRGLGQWARDIRFITSRTTDPSAIRIDTSCLKTIWDECAPLLDRAQTDLGGAISAVLATGGLAATPLSLVIQSITEIWEADVFCRDIMTDVPHTLTDRMSVLQSLKTWQDSGRKIADEASLAKTCFGEAWLGPQSEWAALNAAAAWIDANLDIRAVAAQVPDPTVVASRAESEWLRLGDLLREAESVFSDLCLDKAALFRENDPSQLAAAVVADRFDLWLANSEQLSKWVAYRERADRGRAKGLGQIIDRMEDGRLSPADAMFVFAQSYYEALYNDQVQAEPLLARFDGQVHGRLSREFADLDRQRIAAARLEVVRAHHRRIPQGGGGIGPLGVLRAEIAKRRGHIPIRQLMLRAAPAVQALKPVMMMSPLSVAQFLTPGQLTFDLLVMDEASQIQPVDALGAIARCRQVVVVGDERQLPPTKFFAKMTGGQSEDDDTETAQVSDIESILGLFTARGLPQRMLRWHYRSRHQSLIAVSNTQFYENKLFIVPSPYTQEAGMGLLFHHIREGTFDSGNTRINAAEAIAVAEAVVRHARQNPDLSLGVATFSVKQRRAIQDQLEQLRRKNPDTESYFHAHPSEPFFVKNLENVQGDERDVIFISVGYGRNPQGSMAMTFGPLSAEGGERRLNVLISRAKRRCDVFASITDEDIDLERGKGKGVAAFKLFLHFARTGRLLLTNGASGTNHSVFESEVATALQERGYQVHARVGIAGFFIDLAIGDPDRPGRYLLGIECDGVSYNSARSARDRDRLRQAVLEDHGWIMHRIWSADWFHRPDEQLRLAVAAIDAARAALDSRHEHGLVPRAVELKVVTVDRADSAEVSIVRSSESLHSLSAAAAYVEATPTRPPGSLDLLETPLAVVAEMVEKIVAVEGPIHIDEVTVRVRTAWDLHRSGGRIHSCVERAIAISVHNRRLETQGQFLSVPGMRAQIRDRSSVLSASLRRPDMLPPQELREGVFCVVQANLGGTCDEIALSVSRLMGFKATSTQLREVVLSVVSALLQEDLLIQRGDLVLMNESRAANV